MVFLFINKQNRILYCKYFN